MITIFKDGDTQTQQTHFCLPPDLFRYSNPDCNIDYMFYHCGCNQRTWWPRGEQVPNMKYGLIGRLCPWLLYPLTGITSTIGLFSQCKRILAYGYNTEISGHEDDVKYIIPNTFFSKNSRINNMSHMFEGICLPNKTQITSDVMSGIFTGNTLNVYMMFYQVRHGDYNVNFTNSRNTTIRELFKNHYIANCTACFAQLDNDQPVDDSSVLPGLPQGCVDFSFGNFKSTYASNNYMSSPQFKNVYEGYYRNGETIATTYVKFKAYNSSTQCRDLPDNSTTHNYWPNYGYRE